MLRMLAGVVRYTGLVQFISSATQVLLVNKRQQNDLSMKIYPGCHECIFLEYSNSVMGFTDPIDKVGWQQLSSEFILTHMHLLVSSVGK